MQDLPDILKKVELRLYCQTAGMSNVTVCRIIQDWQPATITYATVTSGSFYTTDSSMTIPVSTAGTYDVWDVTQLVRWGAQFGFRISGTTSTTFESVEGAFKPELVITGFDYP
jgi:hypothetical protein